MEKRSFSQDEDRGEKIILESGVGSTGKFENGETITGQTSKDYNNMSRRRYF